ncbi:MAG: class I SAM-dependent methyltransferase [Bacteroidales bacterium]|nr:class I SAM-dependent methyltransferase [Bacteroidales bacterium]
MAFFRSFVSLVKFGLKYLHFLISARHFKGYGLHSPFIFQLYRKVISKKDDKVLEGIRKFRKYLLKSKTVVDCGEFEAGAGSKYGQKPNRVRLNKIIRSSSVPHKYGKILYYLVRNIQPANILEMGTSVGISTLYLALGWEKARVWSIEASRGKLSIALDNFQTLGITNVYLYNGGFDVQLVRVLDHMPSVDMVFIDGDHKKQTTLNYFELILDFVHNDTVIVIDDIHWSSGMEAAWDQIQDYENVQVSVDLFHMGILFFRKELSPETFKIRY